MAQRNGHVTRRPRARAAAKSVATAGPIASVLEAGTERAQAAMKSITTAAHDVGDRAESAKEQVVTFIEERPLTSVMIAVGVGALAARVISAFRR